jgi:hypothetical protein
LKSQSIGSTFAPWAALVLGGLIAGLAWLGACSSSSSESGGPATTDGADGGGHAGNRASTGGAPSGSGTGGAQAGAGSGDGPGVVVPGSGGAGTGAGNGSGGEVPSSASGGTGAAIAGRSGGGAVGGNGGASGTGGSGGAATANLPKFSFFLTSLTAMRTLSKSQNGFGGDLRYGQADGLSGADEICTEIAESSMPGAGAKQWHAFLSVAQGPAGAPINAADRIGKGPWYDRLGRLVAMTLTDLLQNRPNGADPAIKEDLPNESGTPNHRPDPTQPVADNHHVLTGSDTQGRLYTVNAKSTCLDWTSSSMDNVMTGRPRIGFSWSVSNRTNWISGQDEGGCGAGVAIQENGAGDPTMPFVGSGGGYGGIYCFAMVP